MQSTWDAWPEQQEGLALGTSLASLTYFNHFGRNTSLTLHNSTSLLAFLLALCHDRHVHLAAGATHLASTWVRHFCILCALRRADTPSVGPSSKFRYSKLMILTMLCPENQYLLLIPEAGSAQGPRTAWPLFMRLVLHWKGPTAKQSIPITGSM